MMFYNVLNIRHNLVFAFVLNKIRMKIVIAKNKMIISKYGIFLLGKKNYHTGGLFTPLLLMLLSRLICDMIV